MNYSKQTMLNEEKARLKFREEEHKRLFGETERPQIQQFQKGDKVMTKAGAIGEVVKQDKLIVTIKFENEKKKMNANYLTKI